MCNGALCNRGMMDTMSMNTSYMHFPAVTMILK